MNLLIFSILSAIIIAMTFRLNTNMFYCGIAAFNGPRKLPEHVWRQVHANMRLLAVAMDKRGRDNCGFLMDGQVYHGDSTEKEFKDFLPNVIMHPPKHSSTIMMHARKSSVGGFGVENTHPFKINETDDGFEMAGVHNGTISNWKDLLDDANLNPDDYKVDSNAVMAIINQQRKDEKYLVLEKYEGLAVFCWYFSDEPESLYFFKGASKEYNTSKTEEERPLWIYFDDYSEGVYLCSEKNPLLWIADKKENVQHIRVNKVFKFTNGRCDDDFKIQEINRTNNTRKKPIASTYRHRHNIGVYSRANTPNNSSSNMSVAHINKQKNLQKYKSAVSKRLEKLQSGEGLTDIKPFPRDYYKATIYRDHNLYWRNGHVVKGIWLIDEYGRMTWKSPEKLVLSSTEKGSLYYFVDGLMLRDYGAWKKFTTDEFLTYDLELSYNVRFPIPVQLEGDDKKYFYWNGKKAEGIFVPVFGDKRRYNFVDGVLKNIDYEDVQKREVPKEENTVVDAETPTKGNDLIESLGDVDKIMQEKLDKIKEDEKALFELFSKEEWIKLEDAVMEKINDIRDIMTEAEVMHTFNIRNEGELRSPLTHFHFWLNNTIDAVFREHVKTHKLDSTSDLYVKTDANPIIY